MWRFSWAVVIALGVMPGLVPAAAAQSSIASSSCSDYRNSTDPNQQAQYSAYLQAYANASSPDPRYVKSDAALAEDAKKIRDWCSKNGKRTYGEARSRSSWLRVQQRRRPSSRSTSGTSGRTNLL